MVIYVMAFGLLTPFKCQEGSKYMPKSVGRWTMGAGSPCAPSGSLWYHIITWTEHPALNLSVIFFLSFNQGPSWKRLGGDGRHTHSVVKNCHLNKDNLSGQVNPNRDSATPMITLDAPTVGEAWPPGVPMLPFSRVSMHIPLWPWFRNPHLLPMEGSH